MRRVWLLCRPGLLIHFRLRWGALYRRVLLGPISSGWLFSLYRGLMFFCFDLILHEGGWLFFLRFLQKLEIRFDSNSLKLYETRSYALMHADFFLPKLRLDDWDSMFLLLDRSWGRISFLDNEVYFGCLPRCSSILVLVISYLI